MLSKCTKDIFNMQTFIQKKLKLFLGDNQLWKGKRDVSTTTPPQKKTKNNNLKNSYKGTTF